MIGNLNNNHLNLNLKIKAIQINCCKAKKIKLLIQIQKMSHKVLFNFLYFKNLLIIFINCKIDSATYMVLD